MMFIAVHKFQSCKFNHLILWQNFTMLYRNIPYDLVEIVNIKRCSFLLKLRAENRYK
jgi:hypothetical protein